jgi:uncharacterized protein involved in exopolysaccharide biosynthesis
MTVTPDGQSSSGSSDITLVGVAALILRERKRLLAFTVFASVFAAIAVFLKDRTYTATFSFVPQAAQEQSRAGLASLAGQFGIPLGFVAGGAQQSPQMYADLLRTRDILAPIASDSFLLEDESTRLPISDILKVKGRSSQIRLARTIDALRSEVVSSSVASRTTGVVTVSVRTVSPIASRDIALRLLDGLNRFNLSTLQTRAREESRFTLRSLAAARSTLRTVEDSLQAFLQANRIGAESSPALRFERERLQSSVDLQRQVVGSLAQQYEQSRINEVRDTPVITVVEAPSVPVLADARGGVAIVVMGAILGLALGLLYVLGLDAVERRRRDGPDPDLESLFSEWSRLRRN